MGNIIDLFKFKSDKEERQKREDEETMKRQYDEFIELIKYFVRVEQPKYDVVHIKVFNHNDFEFTDNQGNHISSPLTEFEEMIKQDVHMDDIIISSMINYSARKYIIHNAKLMPESTKEMLKRVFENKLIFFEEW